MVSMRHRCVDTVRLFPMKGILRLKQVALDFCKVYGCVEYPVPQ